MIYSGEHTLIGLQTQRQTPLTLLVQNNNLTGSLFSSGVRNIHVEPKSRRGTGLSNLPMLYTHKSSLNSHLVIIVATDRECLRRNSPKRDRYTVNLQSPISPSLIMLITDRVLVNFVILHCTVLDQACGTVESP